MADSKQSSRDTKQQPAKKLDPKTLNTTPTLNPDIDYINRTLP